MWIVQPTGLIEPAVAPEIYVDGIGGIEITNGIARVYLFTEQSSIASGGEPNKIVAAKIIGPIANIPMVIGQLAQCLWQPAKTCRPHLVR